MYDEEHAAALGDLRRRGATPTCPRTTASRSPTAPLGRHPRGHHATSARALLKAMRAIESANPDTPARRVRRRRLGQQEPAARRHAERPDRALLDQTLSIANLPEDELGNGYEYLIKKFADDSGHTAQEFYTNRTLVHLMTLMLEPQPGESLYDPTCGTGGMLISAAAELKRQGKEWRNLAPLRPGAQLRDLRHRPDEPVPARHRRTATSPTATPSPRPAFREGDRLQTFDVVLANPPYSIKAWNRDALQQRPLRPQHLGRPAAGPRRLRLLPAHRQEPRPEDRALRDPLPARRPLPPRGGRDAAQALVEVRPASSASSASAPGCSTTRPMEAVRRHSAAPRSRPSSRGKVLFINAVNEVAREQAQSFLPRAPPGEDPRRLPRLRGRRPVRRGRDARRRSPTRATASPSRCTSPARRRRWPASRSTSIERARRHGASAGRSIGRARRRCSIALLAAEVPA